MNAAAETVQPEQSGIAVESSLLGTITVTDEQVFRFERGLLGFPECRSFALLPTDHDGMFWLQSTEKEALVFLLIDPFRFVAEYTVDVGAQELGELAAEDASDILVLSIMTLTRTPEASATANLQGPLALSTQARRGRQVVLQDSPFGVRHPVPLPERSGDHG